jgi:D-glycero-D-manno-heptose 1,7-bisphosphate phosphatase
VFLDRDGIINALVPEAASRRSESPLDPAVVTLLPGIAAAVLRIRSAGYLVFGVTNQPAAAKGKVSVAGVKAVQEEVEKQLAAQHAELDDWRLCLHHPQGTVPELTVSCACRKPGTGMLEDLATSWQVDLRRSWVVGDSEADVEAGRTAGCHTVLVEHPDSRHRRRPGTTAEFSVPDVTAAADLVAGWCG